jgi:hypothetical protein
VACSIKTVAQRPEAKEGGREEEEKRFGIATTLKCWLRDKNWVHPPNDEWTAAIGKSSITAARLAEPRTFVLACVNDNCCRTIDSLVQQITDQYTKHPGLSK